MAKTFVTMKTNVGNLVHDTSSDMLTKIGVWINDAYQDAWRRFVWEDILAEEEFSSVIDQQDYDISSDLSITDFGKDLYLVNYTDGIPLERFTVRNWWERRGRDYADESLDSGEPYRYVILENENIRLDPPPDSVNKYLLLYQKTVADLSGDTDTPAITDISTYLEKNALSYAFAYKNQYSKAQWWGNTAEADLQKIIRNENVKINQIYQRVLAGREAPRVHRLLGEKSYDTI